MLWRPLISVIIPTYNRSYCIAAALDSLVAQSYGNWEALVIDDGSTDGTAEVVAARYAGDHRIRYVWQPNGGVAHARNHALRLATGEMIAFLDSDDKWESWKLELQLGAFHRYPDLGMVWTDMVGIDVAGNCINPRYLRQMYAAYKHFKEADLFDSVCPVSEFVPGLPGVSAGARLLMGDIFSQMMMGNLVHTSTVMLRHERAVKVGFFREDYRVGEDYDFHLRTCSFGRVGFLDVSSITYQVGASDQLTNPIYRECFARTFLDTIEPALGKYADRIHLSPAMIRETIAHGHHWLGEALLLEGKRFESRQSLRHSLTYRWELETLLLYLLTYVPVRPFQMARPVLGSVYRGVRRLKPQPGH